MCRARLSISFLLCCVVLLSVNLRAQLPKVAKQAPGSLDGQVVSAKGTPVANAQILWNAADGETPHVLHSDTQGRFHIARLRSGLYELRASSGEKWSEWAHNVNVHPSGTTNVTLRLRLSVSLNPSGTLSLA